MVRLQHERQLENYSFLKGSTYATYLLSFTPSLVGQVPLMLQYMDYQKNRFTDVRQLMVTVESAPLDTIHLMGKRVCTVGGRVKLHVTGKDVYGN